MKIDGKNKNKTHNTELEKPSFISKKISADLITPVLALIKIKDHFPDYHFLFESVEKAKNRGRYSIIGIMPDLIWKCQDQRVYINHLPELNQFTAINQNPISSLRSLISDCQINQISPAFSCGIFGYMSYDMVRFMEELPNYNLSDSISIPDSIFIRPQILIVFDAIFDVINIYHPIYNNNTSLEQANQRIDKVVRLLNCNDIIDLKFQPITDINFLSNFSKQEYCEVVEKAKNYIKNGDIFQVLPSQRFVANFSNQNSLAFYRSLRSINPSPFLFYLKFDDFCLTGSSPEIMVKVENQKVIIRPLAGTRKRGIDSVQDQEITKQLLEDEKEMAEHLMLIDLARHDVGKVCQAGTVKLTEKMVVEYYSHVMHISSTVEGLLDKKFDALDALITGFPAGTVSGAPKIRAMEIIEELEKCKRGFYAGCVGYFSGNGNMETCITLRSALIKDNKIYLQSGAGVVFDSIPEMEYYECHNKVMALIRALENLTDSKGQ